MEKTWSDDGVTQRVTRDVAREIVSMISFYEIVDCPVSHARSIREIRKIIADAYGLAGEPEE